MQAGGVGEERHCRGGAAARSSQIVHGDTHTVAGIDHLGRVASHGERKATWHGR